MNPVRVCLLRQGDRSGTWNRWLVSALVGAAVALVSPTKTGLGVERASAQLRPTADGLIIADGRGGELPVHLRLRIAASTKEAAPTALPPTQLHALRKWQADGETLTSTLAVPSSHLELTARLRREPDGYYSLSVASQVNGPVWLGLVTLEVELPDGAVHLGGRELRMHSLDHSVALGGMDPKWLLIRPKPTTPGAGTVWSMLPDDQFDGVRARREAGKVLLSLDLLSIEARPFTRFVACTENWRAPNHRQVLPARLFQSGESLAGSVTLYNGSAVPLFKARYPDGRQAALVITDHADQTSAGTLRALVGGTSDVSSKQWGKGGLLGAGLVITKALWLTSGEPAPPPLLSATPQPVSLPLTPTANKLPAIAGKAPGHGMKSLLLFRSRYGRPQVDSLGGGRPQLDDPEVAELADQLARLGWEIIPHSATPLRDERDRTEQALSYFSRYKSRSWIDHQPYTNCEALVNQGYQNGPYGIVDLLHRYGYSYAWSGIDVQPGALNLLSPKRLDRYTPVVFPAGRLANGTPDGLWLFSTMMTYTSAEQFYSLYKPKALDQLERERGLHIAHTYLEAFHPPTSPLANRNLMTVGHRPGEVVPSRRLEELLQALSKRVQRGTLWVPTVAQLGDHQRAMEQVSIHLLSDGDAELRSPQAIRGATFVIPRPNLRVFVDGELPKWQRTGRKETTFAHDLSEGKPVRITLRDSHNQKIRFLPPPEPKSLLASNRK